MKSTQKKNTLHVWGKSCLDICAAYSFLTGILTGKEELDVFKLNPQSKSNFEESPKPRTRIIGYIDYLFGPFVTLCMV